MQPDSRSLQSESPGFLHRPLFHLLLIAAFVLAAYSNTFHGPFVFDDIPEIVENPIIKDLSFFLEPDSAKELPAYHGLRMRTVGYFTLALNYRLGGTDVTGYHIFNLAVHLLAAFLVYALVRLTLRAPYFQTRLRGQACGTEWSPAAFCAFVPLLAALLFAVHPIQTQAVTYVIQRLASLSALFCLLSLTAWIQARLSIDSGRRRSALTWFLLALAAAVTAMKTKEIAFTLPVIILLYEFLFFRARLAKRLLYLLPFLLTMLIIPLSRISSDSGTADLLGNADLLGRADALSRVDQAVSRIDYLVTQFRVVTSYIRMLFLPVGQNVDYAHPLYRDFFAPEVFFSFLLLATLFSLALFCLRLSRLRGSDRGKPLKPITAVCLRLIGFGILWFFITLSVESSIIPIDDVMFEHRLFLPSVGFLLALIAAGWWLVHKAGGYWPHAGRAAAVLVAGLVLALTGATFARNQVWQDEVGLWKDVVAKNPRNARGHTNLGSYYDSQGDYEQAIFHYRKALEIDPQMPEALFGMGISHAGIGQLDRAVTYYQRALALKSNDPKIPFNLGVAYMSQGRMNLAARAFQESLRLEPEMVQARMFLDYTRKQASER